MITFHNDRLAPKGLCKLVYDLVPDEYHVPVVFYSRKHGEQGAMGSWHGRRHPFPFVKINLHQIWIGGWGAAWAPAVTLWHELLWTALHEFGHVATERMWDGLDIREYFEEPDGRVYWIVESLADEWADRYIRKLLAWDDRLAQPRHITGYLGGRIARFQPANLKNCDYQRGIVGHRCYVTGGQLTSGDVLRNLELETTSTAYAALRSLPIGVVYRDHSGRQHRLYTWGDLDRLANHPATRDLRRLQWCMRHMSLPPTIPLDPPTPLASADSRYHEPGAPGLVSTLAPAGEVPERVR
jgi:hypothetical protein